MAPKNMVVSGECAGSFVGLSTSPDGCRKGISIYSGGKNIFIEREYIDYWGLSNTFVDKNSAVARGAIGFALFGGIGLLGSATAKKIYQIRIFWKIDLGPSLIEVDESIYNRIVEEYY